MDELEDTRPEMTVEQMLTVIARLYYGWTMTEARGFHVPTYVTVEAFARFAGMTAKVGANTGSEREVFTLAIQAMGDEFHKTDTKEIRSLLNAKPH